MLRVQSSVFAISYHRVFVSPSSLLWVEGSSEWCSFLLQASLDQGLTDSGENKQNSNELNQLILLKELN